MVQLGSLFPSAAVIGSGRSVKTAPQASKPPKSLEEAAIAAYQAAQKRMENQGLAKLRFHSTNREAAHAEIRLVSDLVAQNVQKKSADQILSEMKTAIAATATFRDYQRDGKLECVQLGAEGFINPKDAERLEKEVQYSANGKDRSVPQADYIRQRLVDNFKTPVHAGKSVVEIVRSKIKAEFAGKTPIVFAYSVATLKRQLNTLSRLTGQQEQLDAETLAVVAEAACDYIRHADNKAAVAIQSIQVVREAFGDEQAAAVVKIIEGKSVQPSKSPVLLLTAPPAAEAAAPAPTSPRMGLKSFALAAGLLSAAGLAVLATRAKVDEQTVALAIKAGQGISRAASFAAKQFAAARSSALVQKLQDQAGQFVPTAATLKERAASVASEKVAQGASLVSNLSNAVVRTKQAVAAKLPSAESLRTFANAAGAGLTTVAKGTQALGERVTPYILPAVATAGLGIIVGSKLAQVVNRVSVDTPELDNAPTQAEVEAKKAAEKKLKTYQLLTTLVAARLVGCLQFLQKKVSPLPETPAKETTLQNLVILAAVADKLLPQKEVEAATVEVETDDSSGG